MKYLVIVGLISLSACEPHYKITMCGDTFCVEIHKTNSRQQCQALADILIVKYSSIYFCEKN